MQKISKGVRQDDSLYSFRELIKHGYTHGIWVLHENHPEYDICDTFDGKVFDLVSLISNLKYSAPIFETSHVQCICRLICYSTTDKSLDHIIVDWKGEAEVGRKVDKKDKKERSKDFYRLYENYRKKYDTLKNDKYLTGSDSEPENGLYSFPIVLDETYYYNPASKKKISDEILNIILDQAQKYSVNVMDAQLSGADYEVQLEHPLSIYDYSKSDLMDLSWTLTERTNEITEVMHELDDITNFLKTTQNKINELLINYENNLTEPKEPKVQQDIPEQKTEPISNVELEKAVEQNKPNIVEPYNSDRIKSFEDIPKLPEEEVPTIEEDTENELDFNEEIL
jgi:hypothetical protein